MSKIRVLPLLRYLLLLAAIIITTIYFYRQDKFAGWLMVPYILWVSFATGLNGTIWLMN